MKYPEKTGMESYRRKLKAANRDKLAIFIDDKYGVYITYEPFVVMDMGVTEAKEPGATKETILERYNLKQKKPT